MSDQKKPVPSTGRATTFHRPGETFSRERFDVHDPFKSVGNYNKDFDDLMFRAVTKHDHQ